ncbi:SH3 domain-binding glutamic acid-rich-like protein 3 [Exaiptasia diaphana]|uniref:SH3 domain-binding glutamic acid-rich-like protein 3 n=1 Tax=Exaiptasia diaphana TaxID=2652724 RepID=A0A913X8Y3_EXADI|nr:SH3 domain-binding glutamic acid-rich-like protein 3 [Exaiptasia diaphana]KXJ14035.1 SH3 domain-binding glutamic acid-rich-like protein 3 [Exaiptasia diaphana]
MAEIQVYISSISSSQEIKKNQHRIRDILGDNFRGQLSSVTYIDIATDSKQKDKMREIVGDPKALPPQICKGNEYLGDYMAFDNAVEDGDIKGFLKL